MLVTSLVVQGYGLYSPEVPGPGGVTHLDKVGHALAFGLPAALAWLLGARWLVVALLLHALVSEVLQGTLTARQPDPWDAVANLVGLAGGVLFARAFRRRWGEDGAMDGGPGGQ
jgi:VanZ family protein